jgi:hypothetical protein
MKGVSSMHLIESATVPVIKLQVDLQVITSNDGNDELVDETMRTLGIDITFEDISK